MEQVRISIDSIIVGTRHRALDSDSVGRLADSMAAIGLQQPITIWVDAKDMGHLIAGRHRLEAARKLGWEDIDAIVVELSKHDRTLWEIDENLVRADLSDDEKRNHLRRRKRLWGKRQEMGGTSSPTLPHCTTESGKSFPTLPHCTTGRGNEGFATETAKATGISKRRVNQLLADPPDKPPPSPEDVTAKQLKSLKNAWNRAGADARQQFRDYIDEPIMDKRFRVIDGGA